jgi:hypothetical protein
VLFHSTPIIKDSYAGRAGNEFREKKSAGDKAFFIRLIESGISVGKRAGKDERALLVVPEK